MNQLKGTALAAAFALAYAGSAAAEVEPGFYAGVGVGQSTVEIDDVDFDEDDTGFKLFGGYQFNQYLSAELTYIDGGTAETSVALLFDDISDRVEVEPTAINIQVIGTLPFNEKFGAMARAGVSFIDTDVTIRFGVDDSVLELDDKTEEFAYGIGLWAAPISNLLVRFEYEASSGNFQDEGTDSVGDTFGVDTDFDLSLISLSAAYKFAL